MWHFSIRTLISACIILYVCSANFDVCECRSKRTGWGHRWRWPRPRPPARLRRSPSIRPLPLRMLPPPYSPKVTPARRRSPKAPRQRPRLTRPLPLSPPPPSSPKTTPVRRRSPTAPRRRPPVTRPLPQPPPTSPKVTPVRRRRPPTSPRRRPPLTQPLPLPSEPLVPLLPPPPPITHPRRPAVKEGQTTFNVLDYGARGNGRRIDSSAFRYAWEDACKVNGSRMVVPDGHVFLVGPIAFLGEHCQPNMVFQLDGTMVAPKSRKAWGNEHGFWIQLRHVKGLTIEGKGKFDGSGSVWWENVVSNKLEDNVETDYDDNDDNDNDNDNDDDDDVRPGVPVPENQRTMKAKVRWARPTALRIYETNNVTIRGVTIQDSPSCHLNFENCNGVLLHDLNVSSPGDSPNTVGIQLHNSQHVVIRESNLSCGGDCVAISAGSSNVRIHDVNCGPGHGISIGSLGKNQSKACVSDIIVRDVHMQNTSNGVRIESWQGGRGSVHGVVFSNIRVSRVHIPIIIDQFYCDHAKCRNHTSAVEVSDIAYNGIRGTFTGVPVHFACSDSVPCTKITLGGIDLTLDPENQLHHHRAHAPLCRQTFGSFTAAVSPQMDDCLLVGNPFNKRNSKVADSC